ncbi:hypothetical protein E6O75_ATG06193 [Venturia nashicola]|uniref:Uncharacterized protein n=1 Tax=Venturia nashicola TaxID=86259 RepID=A0A4Z1NSM7_9PEZI|nr:hypothetical protein E6O75_ATG06193 [Venturia nashicola]
MISHCNFLEISKGRYAVCDVADSEYSETGAEGLQVANQALLKRLSCVEVDDTTDTSITEVASPKTVQIGEDMQTDLKII